MVDVIERSWSGKSMWSVCVILFLHSFLDVRYVFAAFNSLDQLQTSLHDKWMYSEDSAFIG